MPVLDTSHVKLPAQYSVVFPAFCSIIITRDITDITKYTYAGVHSDLT